ncbi:MAG: hypothetical protein RL693_1767 [Verrucomicrobiota bacterium]|jgi:signal transduction histidine kinase
MNLANPHKIKRTELSRLYLAALRTYLNEEPTADLESARELGRHAIRIGLETLDLARIHEIALVSLVLPHYSTSANDGLMGRAGVFFAEALTPIEQTHRGAREANINLTQIVKTLSLRTMELADSVEELKQEIRQRKMVEESLRSSEQTTSELLGESHRMQEELRDLSHQLLSAQEEERRKISRELHDVISQTLTGINVRLAELKVESRANTDSLQHKIESTQLLVEQSVEIVHRFARELRPTLLDDLGLIPALQAFMKSFMEETGIRVSLKCFAGVEQLDEDKRTVLYRVAQESLTNVARHSKASRADVCIQRLDERIRMEIVDDGQGFEVQGTSSAKKSNRLGLLGMRERVEMVGGLFCVESTPGNPTTVRVEIPVESKPLSEKTEKTTNLECP